jgi:hypothetical protein
MTTGEADFLKILTRVIKLYDEIRIFNTSFNRFDYKLEEKNGRLVLTVSFPINAESVVITYDTKQRDKFEKKLKEAEDYLYEKRSNSSCW